MLTRLMLVALALLVLTATGCGPSSAAPSGRSAQSPATVTASPRVAPFDAQALRSAFAARGLPVASDPATASLLAPPARYLALRVDGSFVNIFSYPTSEEASVGAADVRSDGYAVGATEIVWKGLPHFFRRDRVIVLYLSRQDTSVESPAETRVLEVLRQQMGRPFAGVR